ncbi:serine dehydratase subunit alpha family protein [Terasakiella pusilla]|uniref:L-cysteine desulfidase family protein n=1 Tax=Terasakiella pusilla TaxID=64973 RepID=UPI000491433C|nr:L-serine ammonia-lyase, iron-sulfur-dependent, subunit alpha [Terasakiella pusilla]
MQAPSLIFQNYLEILKQELVPATGCTEPIAIAYAAAKARDVLGEIPDRAHIQVSGNIIKNTKSVVVPNTGELKGIRACIAAGVIAGKAERQLEVISAVTHQQRGDIQSYLAQVPIDVQPLDSDYTFDLIVTLSCQSNTAQVRISQFHTNIVEIRKDDHLIFNAQNNSLVANAHPVDRTTLQIREIIAFADEVDLEEVRPLVEKQINYNTRIANAGLQGDWGANIGSVLLDTWGHDVKNRAKAMAAAGSDARMGGCELPVIIVTGSGNQGIATSLPVIEYAFELKADRDQLLRALIVANLVAVHIKTGIGWLSAFCGAVSAGTGAAAGIAYLHGETPEVINHTIANTLGSVSGIICDGAKPACASKIAASVEAGILGFHMARKGQHFQAGEGIIAAEIEKTIENVGRLGRIGMRETDTEILHMMLEEDTAAPTA